MNIKPIETVYNGYRFRSRLEARWAVFFDAAGIEYQYEPEGFELQDGTKYLPDFYLPLFDMYVEIKPSNISNDDRQKAKDKLWNLVLNEHSYHAGLYCEGDPAEHNMQVATGAIDADKECPEVFLGWFRAQFERNVFVSYPKLPETITELDVVFASKTDNVRREYELIPYRYCISVVVWNLIDDEEWRFDFTNGKNIVQRSNIPFHDERDWFIEQACIKARQARFEHGEKPNVRSVAV